MPAVGIAVVAAAAAAGTSAVIAGSAAVIAALGVTGAIVAGAVAGAVVAIGISYGLSAALGLNKSANRSVLTEDRKQMVRSSVEARQVIYGHARVSGPIIYASSSGPDLRFLHLVVPLACHPVHDITNVWINDVLVTPDQIDASGNVVAGQLSGKCRIRKYRGDQTAADPDLVAESTDGWSAQHILYGCAYLYVRLEYDTTAYPTGLSNLSAEVQGRRVYDPRNGSVSFNNNWALCILDYLRSDFGLACAEDEINYGAAVIAANLSDEGVQLDAAATQWQRRYECDGAFKLDEAPIDIIEKMLSAGAGVLVYVQGKYEIRGGAYEPPSDVLTAADLAGDLEIVTKPSRKDIFNGVRGTFVDPQSLWQATDFTPWQSPTYLAADGEEIWREIELPFTIDSTRCQRLAKQLVLTERESLQINATLKYGALRHTVMQTLAVTMPDLGWRAKAFRIRSWRFDPITGLVTLTLREEGAGSYGWLYDEAASIPPSPDTNLISPLSIPAPTNLGLTPTTALNSDGAAVPALLVTWTPAAHAFVTATEVQWRVSGTNDWNSIEVPSPASRYVIAPVIVGQSLDVRVRAVAILARSAWSGILAATGQRDTTAPGDPLGPTVTGAIQQIVVRWTNPADVDLAKIEIWETGVYDFNTAYKQGESYSDFFVRQIAAGETRHIWLRAMDRSGNVSNFVYAGWATARHAETGDIAQGAVTGLAVDSWDAAEVSSEWVEIMSCSVGDAIHASSVAVTAQLLFNGAFIYTPGPGGDDSYELPRGSAELLINGSVVRTADMSGSGVTIIWGGTLGPGAVRASVRIRQDYGAAHAFGDAYMIAQTNKR
jgi:hypothetical protein